MRHHQEVNQTETDGGINPVKGERHPSSVGFEAEVVSFEEFLKKLEDVYLEFEKDKRRSSR